MCVGERKERRDSIPTFFIQKSAEKMAAIRHASSKRFFCKVLDGEENHIFYRYNRYIIFQPQLIVQERKKTV